MSLESPMVEWMRGRNDLRLPGRPRADAGAFIPTWQQGREQPHPNDFAAFAREGYSKNSLVFACIREKATSFAPLQPILTRTLQDGSVEKIERHAVLELLQDPNANEDAVEFNERLATSYDATGNVFIRKVRQSSNPVRARAWRGRPVQELDIIRTDHVTILPGAQRWQDQFVVTVGGRERARIPRADMIHLKTTNIINDFYGLAPLAVIMREVTIDLEMSDYELAFYRNAGVPMGILYVKGRQTPQQTAEAKSLFRNAFNGFRKWFDLLVLNETEAKYERLGLPQSDQEGDNTRFNAESRICATFGVPPGVVGARIAIGPGAAPRDPEKDQFQLWSETLVPFTRRVATAYQRGLFPEFAASDDRGATLGYDLTVVRALQEDLSRKLREVTRLINTGGVMVSQAFRTVGLTPPPNSDFFIRSGNQAQVTIEADGTIRVQQVQQVPNGGTAEPANPMEGAA